MEKLNERLLSAWLTLSTVVDNERLVSSIPFNEAHVCNLLYQQRRDNPDEYLTATDLCASTRMLKSQMNKVLASLEKRNMITRFPSPDDKRKAYIKLVEENLHLYEAIHARTMLIVDHAIEQFGVETSEKMIDYFLLAAKVVDESLSHDGVRSHKW